MAKEKVSENFSFKGWELLKFLQGRKKLAITIIGLVATQLALDPELATLLAGGAVFEGVWSVLEYFCTKVKLKN